MRVPRENLLDRYAQVSPEGEYTSPIEDENRRFFTMLGTLIQGRISVGGAAISATKTALTIAIRHGARRAPVRPARRRMTRCRCSTTACISAASSRPSPASTPCTSPRRASSAELDRIFGADDGRPERSPEEDQARRELETRAAGLKALATWHATETIQVCREACGGAGYLSENRLGELKADTDVFTTFEGDNTILLQLVAKSLLTGYRDEFGELNPIGVAAFVAGQVWESVIERTAAREVIQRLTDDLVPGREREEDLLDREYHLGLFRWREEHVLSGAARRLKRGIDSGEEPFDVFNDCQDHVLAAARAHTEREILESFAGAIERCEDGALAAILGRVCDLHALAEVERDRAWFQEHGRISSTRAKAITRQVNALCAELRPLAVDLVDAFGIPDELIGAPIGLPGGEASRGAAAETGDELPDVRMLVRELGSGTAA